MTNWPWIGNQPYWRGVVVLCSRSTPLSHMQALKRANVDAIIHGKDQVDLRAALQELRARYGAEAVRVDSGGVLNGALLRAGLVDEVSLGVVPCLVGGTAPASIFVAPDSPPGEHEVPLRLMQVEKLKGGSVWLRYEVIQ